MNKTQFVAELSKLRPSSTFLTLKGYRNEFSEVADYSIVFHMSYQNALVKSISTLEQYIPQNDLEVYAKNELLDSFNASLNKIAEIPIEEIEDGYTRFYDNGKYIKGVKLHNASDTLHLYGLVSQKKVIIPGFYPKKNKRALTIAKDKLRHMCPTGKFRQFKILPQNVDLIKVENISLLPPG
jgi:hypothetical protein